MPNILSHPAALHQINEDPEFTAAIRAAWSLLNAWLLVQPDMQRSDKIVADTLFPFYKNKKYLFGATLSEHLKNASTKKNEWTPETAKGKPYLALRFFLEDTTFRKPMHVEDSLLEEFDKLNENLIQHGGTPVQFDEGITVMQNIKIVDKEILEMIKKSLDLKKREVENTLR